MPRQPNRPSRRSATISLRWLLVATFVVLILLTAGGVTFVISVAVQRTISEMESRFFRAAAGSIADSVTKPISSVQSLLRLCQSDAAEGRLNPAVLDDVERYLHVRLLAEPAVSSLLVAFPEPGATVLARRAPDGRIATERTSAPRPSNGAVRSQGGWTAVTPNPSIASDVIARGSLPIGEPSPGENTGGCEAELSNSQLSKILASSRRYRNAVTLVVSPRGDLLATSGAWPQELAESAYRAALAALPSSLETLPRNRATVVTASHQDQGWFAAFEPFEVESGPIWFAVIIAPEDQFLNSVLGNRRDAATAAALLTTVAIGLGLLLAHFVSQPLASIVRDLEAVGRFSLEARSSSRSHVRDIATLSDAVERMKASLRSFSRYVPIHLVRDVVATGHEARLGGQIRPLTIHFADIEDFTSIAERMPPDVLVSQLGAYLSDMTEILESEHGTVDKFMGDGILAFFNAPGLLPDHAAHACRSALRCQRRLSEIEQAGTSLELPGFRARIGLDTGDVLVGNIGTPNRFAYTVIGDAVNVASRLESLGKVYHVRILASDAVKREAGDDFEWWFLDRVAVFGRQGHTHIYELLGEKGAVDVRVLRHRDAYEQALRKYFDMRFREAADEFRDLAAHEQGASAAGVLAVRAGELANSPPVHWTGIYLPPTK
ncbi:MAG: adenylate/guanylate cyclase domain-containing protein [Chloroflexota bacterium]